MSRRGVREGRPHRLFRLLGAFETAVWEAALRRKFFNDARRTGKISRGLLFEGRMVRYSWAAANRRKKRRRRAHACRISISAATTIEGCS